MPRSLTALLVCLGLHSLSCGFVDAGSPPLPIVSSPPPAIAAPLALPAPAVARSPQAPAPAYSDGDSLAPAIADYLRSYHTGLARHEIDELARTIVAEAQRYDFDPSLLLAVMHVESGYYNFAVSSVGALGLMQMLPSTGEYMARKLDVAWHGPLTLFDPVTNVRLGAAYLSQLSRRYRSLQVALAAYNWGPARIDSRLRRGVAVPTRYTQLVLDAYGERTSEIDRSS